jgi:membrane-associated phospholipid phosphatase
VVIVALTDVDRRRTWTSEVLEQTAALDRAIGEAVDRTETPTLDRFLVRLSDAANNSRLWLLTAAAVAVVGGPRGRRAAGEAVASIALASATSNLALKSLARRSRPEIPDGQVVASRRVRRPMSPSFPSGHAASAFAFASTMGEEVPVTWVPLHVAASLVSYARVHTGVHYPSDVMAGALVGALSGWTVRRLAGRLAPPPHPADSDDVAAG